jgi:hypothetical protein
MRKTEDESQFEANSESSDDDVRAKIEEEEERKIQDRVKHL